MSVCGVRVYGCTCVSASVYMPGVCACVCMCSCVNMSSLALTAALSRHVDVVFERTCG